MQPKPITTGFITTHHSNIITKYKSLLGLINLFMQLSKIPGIYGDRTHLLSVAESQLPFFQTQFKSGVQNRLFYAIFDPQGFLSLFH